MLLTLTNRQYLAINPWKLIRNIFLFQHMLLQCRKVTKWPEASVLFTLNPIGSFSQCLCQQRIWLVHFQCWQIDKCKCCHKLQCCQQRKFESEKLNQTNSMRQGAYLNWETKNLNQRTQWDEWRNPKIWFSSHAAFTLWKCNVSCTHASMSRYNIIDKENYKNYCGSMTKNDGVVQIK